MTCFLAFLVKKCCRTEGKMGAPRMAAAPPDYRGYTMVEKGVLLGVRSEL